MQVVGSALTLPARLRALSQALRTAGRERVADLQLLVTHAVEAVDGAGAAIRLLDGQQATTGLLTTLGTDLGGTLGRQCEAAQHPTVCRDARTDLRVRHVACQTGGVASLVAVPLVHAGRSMGHLLVVSTQAAAFTPESVSDLDLLAGVMAPVAAGWLAGDRAERRGLMLDAAATGLVAVDAGGRVVDANPAFATLVGRELGGVLGRPFTELTHSRIEAGADGDHRMRGPDGQSIHAHVVAVSVEDGTGRGYTVATVEDRRRQRTAERALQELNDELGRVNEELSEFAYLAAHDLRSPLQLVVGYAELLAAHAAGQIEGDPALWVEKMRKAAERGGALIDDLLAFCHAGTSPIDPAPVDVVALVSEIRHELADRLSEREAVVTGPPRPVAIRAHAGLLRQLLANLVSNACTYVAPGTSPLVTISVEAEGDWQILAVEDNGIGVAVEDRERIFSMFTRLHPRSLYEGTGIGLALCRRIAERHGGLMWVEDGAGGGSRFCVRLPA